MEELTQQVTQLAIGLLGSVLAWAAVEARKWIKQRVDNEYVRDLLLRVESAVETGVREASRGVAKQLKEAAADGKITAEERASIIKHVRGSAIDQLTQVDRKRLEELFDKEHLQRKLDVLIEAAVQKIKEKR